MPRPPGDQRDRLLRRASEAFYAEGIHAVGVDRIIADAQTTRATFYRHFPSKEDLIVAYLRAADGQIRADLAGRVEGAPPAEAIRRVAASIAGQISGPGFRGCAFLNAVTEYPDPGHPVYRVVTEHRDWFLRTVTELFGDEPAARQFVMLRDGAMTSGCVAGADQVRETFLAAVEGLLAAHPVAAH
jgi:AcrR family transcriptional regulator